MHNLVPVLFEVGDVFLKNKQTINETRRGTL